MSYTVIGALVASVATGLLPCGLSWTAIALAALPTHWRRRAAYAAGPALIVLAVLTAARAGVPGTRIEAALVPDCCAEHAGETP